MNCGVYVVELWIRMEVSNFIKLFFFKLRKNRFRNYGVKCVLKRFYNWCYDRLLLVVKFVVFVVVIDMCGVLMFF